MRGLRVCSINFVPHNHRLFARPTNKGWRVSRNESRPVRRDTASHFDELPPLHRKSFALPTSEIFAAAAAAAAAPQTFDPSKSRLVRASRTFARTSLRFEDSSHFYTNKEKKRRSANYSFSHPVIESKRINARRGFYI